MKRSPFKSRGIVWTSSEAQQAREHARELRNRALFKSPPIARKAVMVPATAAPTNPVAPKLVDRKSKAIRDSAKGEECLVRIPGICTGNPEHTIWSHAPFGAAGKGRGLKSLDLCGAMCCVACDQAIDGQRPLPAGYDRAQALLDWMFGHLRSLVRLRQKGLA